MAAKIYIIPNSGKYDGKLLVFDTVESMSHIRTAKVPQHPVESLNRSAADHRFRDGAKIQITGAISDNWDSRVTDEPRPAFKTVPNKEQALIRDKIQNEFPRGTLANKVINQILDKKTPRAVDLERVTEAEFNGQERGTFWLAKANRALETEVDSLDIAQLKQLSQVGSRSNDYSQNFNVNTITQARELLNELDRDSVLVTVVSMFEVYENMVVTNFTNVLRNGPQRGAYWVTLSLEEQLVAKAATKEIVVDSVNSEEVSSVSDKGKRSRNPVGKNDPIYKKVEKIYKEELEKVARGNPEAFVADADIKYKVEKSTDGLSEEGIILGASHFYVNNGEDTEAAEESARTEIRTKLLAASQKPGK